MKSKANRLVPFTCLLRCDRCGVSSDAAANSVFARMGLLGRLTRLALGGHCDCRPSE